MRRKLKLAGLYGGIIGCCFGLLLFLTLPFLFTWLPDIYQLADPFVQLAEPLTSLGIRLLCGPSPTMGCASGFGTMIVFVLWPLLFCLFYALIGAMLGVIFTLLYKIIRSHKIRNRR